MAFILSYIEYKLIEQEIQRWIERANVNYPLLIQSYRFLKEIPELPQNNLNPQNLLDSFPLFSQLLTLLLLLCS